MDSLETLDEVADKPTSRRRFLKQLGVTMIVGAGAGIFAKTAKAANNCCYNPGVCGALGCDYSHGWAHLWCTCPNDQSYCWDSYCIQGGCIPGPC